MVTYDLPNVYNSNILPWKWRSMTLTIWMKLGSQTYSVNMYNRLPRLTFLFSSVYRHWHFGLQPTYVRIYDRTYTLYYSITPSNSVVAGSKTKAGGECCWCRINCIRSLNKLINAYLVTFLSKSDNQFWIDLWHICLNSETISIVQSYSPVMMRRDPSHLFLDYYIWLVWINVLRSDLSTGTNSYSRVRIRTFRTPRYEFVLLEYKFVPTATNLYLPTFNVLVL